jgi:predicted ATPase/DNA-binding SARP family transcriptional activator
MPNLSLSLLGPFAATLDQRPITRFRTKSAQALLIYLVCKPERSSSREGLLGLFWPELPQSSAQKRLRDALYWLRKTIPEVTSSSDSDLVPLLLADRHTVQISPAAAYELDIDRFNGLLNQDIAEWPAAVNLYRGDFLADVYLPDSNNLEAWVSARRAELRRQMFQALDVLTNLALRSGDFATAEDYARRQLALDDLRESAHRQLMETLAGRGRRRAALSQYERLVQLMYEELAAEPSAETQALYQAIRSDEFNGNIDVKAQRATPLPNEEGIKQVQTQPGPPHNLPPQATPFIGREQELAELQALLADPQTRLITIVGPGGMGKTRLALACAERLVGAQRAAPLHEGSSPPPSLFEHGLFFVDLAPLDNVEQLVPTLAQLLNFPLRSGDNEKRNPRQQLLDYLRRKQMLLLLDNFEHLLDGADLAADILDSAPEVQLLVTSRERLQLYGEQSFAIHGLEYPETIPEGSSETGAAWAALEDAAKYTAVKLFLQSAGRLRRNFRLQGDDLTYLSHICHLVEGMPLAIELAAGWVDLLSLPEIYTELALSLDVLETGARNVPRRQRSLRAVFDRSWERLSQEERGALARFSLFRGGCTREAAGAVSGASLPTLSNLANKSLIRFRRSDSRYQMHELLRQYAAEKLALNPEAEAAAQDGHSAYYCQALAAREENLKGNRQLEAMAEIAADSENVRAAWRRATEQLHLRQLGQAMGSLCLFYQRSARFQERESACRRVVARLREALSTEESGTRSADMLRLQVRALAWQDYLRFPHAFGHSTDPTRQLLRQALALLDKSPLADQDTRTERATIMMQLAFCESQHDLEQARRLGDESLALYRGLGDKWGLASALYALGHSMLRLDNYDVSRRLYEEGLLIQRDLKDWWGMAASLSALAHVVGLMGQHEEGEQLKREALSIFRKTGDRSEIVDALSSVGSHCVWQGKFAEARALAREYIPLAEELEVVSDLASARAIGAFPDAYSGRYEAAQRQAQRNLALGREIDHMLVMGLSLAILGQVALAEEAYVEAHHHFQECAAFFRAVGSLNNVDQALACLGYAARGLGQRAQAQQYVFETVKGASERHDFLPLIHALPGIALLMADQGEKERAVELYALAKTQGMVANSKWFEDIAGRHMAEIAATLPPEVAAEAEACGRARDLWESAAELSEELEALGWGEGS